MPNLGISFVNNEREVKKYVQKISTMTPPKIEMKTKRANV
jgi:hypothetical protein